MSLITSVYRELVMGGHILALGTASIAAASAIMLGGNPTAVLLIMAYLFSYGAYMMNRSAEMEEDAVSNPMRTGYLARREKYLPLITLSCFATGYLLAALTNLFFFLALLLPLFLSLLYSVGSGRLVRLLGARKLKEKLLFKNITISFGWSLIPLLVALYYQRVSLELLLIAPFIFLRLMLNTIFFDVRDLEGDKANGIRTLPVAFGRERSFRAMAVLDLLSSLYLVSLVGLALLPPYSLILVLLPVYSALYRWLASSERAMIGFLCDFVADGEYVLWGPLIYLGKILF